MPLSPDCADEHEGCWRIFSLSTCISSMTGFAISEVLEQPSWSSEIQAGA